MAFQFLYDALIQDKDGTVEISAIRPSEYVQSSISVDSIVRHEGLLYVKFVACLIGVKVDFDDGLVWRVWEAAATNYCQKFALVSCEKTAS